MKSREYLTDVFIPYKQVPDIAVMVPVAAIRPPIWGLVRTKIQMITATLWRAIHLLR